MLTTTFMEQYLPVALSDEFSNKDKNDIENNIIKHILNLTSYSEYAAKLRNYMKTSELRMLRNISMANFDISVSMKHSLLNILSNDHIMHVQAKKIFHKFATPDFYHLVKRLRKDHPKIPPMKMKFSSLSEINDKCKEIVCNLNLYIKKYTVRKLWFVITSNNFNLDDIVSEIQEKIILVFWHVIPFKTEQHTINILKRAIHNKGINIIKYYNAIKRRRINNDGQYNFYNTIVSLDYHAEGLEGENFQLQYNNMVDEKTNKEVETRLAYDSLINRCIKTHNLRHAASLKLLRLDNDPQFSRYAKDIYPDIIKSKSLETEIIFDKLGRTRFLRLIRLFVSESKAPFYRFIKQIQVDMSDVRHAYAASV